MLRIRLQRRGKKNYATYRVVIADHRAPIQGRFVADMGHYNPHTNEFVIKKESITQWISQGAKPTPTVHNLLVRHGVVQAPKVRAWRPKKKAEAKAA